MTQLDIIDFCNQGIEETQKQDIATETAPDTKVLVVIDESKLNPIEVFSSPNDLTHIDRIIEEIESRVKSEVYDVSTEDGRSRINSVARQIGSAKQRLVEIADGLTEDWKNKTSAVNDTKKYMIAKFDSLRDEIREPVIEYKRIMQERIDGHNKAIAGIDALQEYASISYDVFSIDVALLKVESLFNDRDWQEFRGNAEYSFLKTKQALETAKNHRIRFDEEQVELARLAEIKRQEEIDRIKLEAAEKARVEAEEKAAIEAREAAAKAEREKADIEAKAKEERDRIQREKEDSDARAKKAEEDRIAAEEKAKADADAAEKKRLADIEQARKDEESRQQKIRDDEAAEAARREADRNHKAQIHNAIKSALSSALYPVISDETAKEIVTAIACGNIPHIKIVY